MHWQRLVDALERCVPSGTITSYAEVAHWLWSTLPQTKSVIRVLREARDNGFMHLTSRVVGAGGNLYVLGDSHDQQKEQLLSEGISFTDDGRVDLEVHKPVRLT